MSDTAYWKRRARELGERAVLNASHTRDQLSAVTLKQKCTLYPLLREALDGSEHTVLDFGCGTGRFPGDLAELVGGRVVGLDPIPGFLELAPRHETVEYRIMRPGLIPLPDGWADVVWVCIVLGGITHENVLRRTARELERVLHPGGLLFLVENTAEQPPAPHWVFRSTADYVDLFTAVRLAPISEYHDLGERISVLSGHAD